MEESATAAERFFSCWLMGSGLVLPDEEEHDTVRGSLTSLVAVCDLGWRRELDRRVEDGIVREAIFE